MRRAPSLDGVARCAIVALAIAGCRDDPPAPASSAPSASAVATPAAVPPKPSEESFRWSSGETRTIVVRVAAHEADAKEVASVEKALVAAGMPLDRIAIKSVRGGPDGIAVRASPLHRGIAIRKAWELRFDREGHLAPEGDRSVPALDELPTEPKIPVAAAVGRIVGAAMEKDRNPVGEVEAQLFYERDAGTEKWRLVWGVGLGGAGSGFVDATTGDLLLYEPGAGVIDVKPGETAPVGELEGVTITAGEVRLLTNPTAIFFVDADRGYVVGDYGRMSRTDDGGKSFRTLDTTTAVESLQSAWFTSKDVGFVAGGCRRPLCDTAHATVLATRDGGETFRLTTLDSAHITSLGFVDEKRGFGVAQNALWSTIDAGETWTKQDVPRDPAVRHITVTGGDLVGSAPGGGVFRSRDGGLKWTEQGRIEGRGALPSVWIDDRRGVARDAKALYWTKDGGKTWTPTPTDLGPARALWFVDERTGFAIAKEALLGTRDGGAHWTPLTDPARSGFVTELHFASPAVGFAIGRGVVRIEIAAPPP